MKNKGLLLFLIAAQFSVLITNEGTDRERIFIANTFEPSEDKIPFNVLIGYDITELIARNLTIQNESDFINIVYKNIENIVPQKYKFSKEGNSWFLYAGK